MARPRYALARQEAERVLAENEVTAPDQIDLRRIAESLGATVVEEPFIGAGMSGVLIREPGKRPIIGVNKGDVEPRKRFTIAHELGHLLLHNDPYHVDTQIHLRDRRSSTAESIAEVEANQFAANLLMPARMLQKDLLAMDVIDIDGAAEELAAKYGVSLQAMTLRIAKLEKYGL